MAKRAPPGAAPTLTPVHANPVITPRGASRPKRIPKNEVDRWRRKDFWTVFESAFLLCGYLPTSVWAASWTPNVKRRLREAIDLVERGRVAGNLRALDNKGDWVMRPADVIAWADPILFPRFPFPRTAQRNVQPVLPVLDARKLADLKHTYDAIRADTGKEPSQRAVAEKSGYDRETVAKYWPQLVDRQTS